MIIEQFAEFNMIDQEIEFKYKVDAMDFHDFMDVVTAIEPSATFSQVNYQDHYYVHEEDSPGRRVSHFIRQRVSKGLKGQRESEVTIKALETGAKQGVRKELNRVMQGSTSEVQEFILALGYREVLCLDKWAIIGDLDDYVLSLDQVNGTDYYFEIELRYPHLTKNPVTVLTKHEKLFKPALKISKAKRINELLFELYSPYRLDRV